MNRKGQQGVGTFVMIAITAIVGMILLVAIAQENGKMLDTTVLDSFSLGTQTNGTVYYFADYKSIDGTIAVAGNGTDNPVVLSSGNYTITNRVINPSTGLSSASFEPTSEYTGTTWSINATTVQPLTYVGDSGARSVVVLITIMFALAIALVVLEPTLRSGLLNMIGK